MLRRRTIDVVVPVCGGHEEFGACVEAVRHHGGKLRLVVVDDCSGDALIGELVGRLSMAKAPRVVLLRNERKLGFAATANRGIAAGRNDVVLLGADALVTKGWLDKIGRCAISDPSIATVTPLTDDDGVCSVAISDEGKTAPDGPERVNLAAEAAAVPLYPDTWAATPLCLFIRRQALRAIGAFDEALGNGDDAVRDFSVRAREAGYRNVLCDDTFVGRGGAGSADGQTARDPIEAIRGMVRSQVALLPHPGKPGVLHVLHDRGGGTEKYVRDLIRHTRDSHCHFFFRILPDRWRLTDVSSPAPTNYECRRAGDGTMGGWLGSLCAWLRIERIHVHSLVGSGDDLLRILDATGLPYCYTVHDMYLPCPTVYLIDSQGEYCEATTDVATCRRCLSRFRAWEDVDIEGWRRRYRDFLARADRVFAPSVWARDTLVKYFPGAKVDVAPPRAAMRNDSAPIDLAHAFSLPDDGCRHVGVLGAIGPEKGARHLEMLVARIRERGLPLRVVLIGYTDRDNRSQSDDGVFTVHGRYRGEEIAALLDHYRIVAVVFPAVWPETFSYTLSESWLAGRPALVPPGGALQERVLSTGAGWIMPGWPDADAILDQLLELTAPDNRVELTHRAQLAQAASRDGAAALDPVREFYEGMRAGTNRNTGHVVSRRRIYESACLALGIEPAGVPAPRAAPTAARGGASKASLFRLFRG
jgi:GT2 family glycosyltransferase/glycosyltransferase involved in cell wall biosynthesis